jgi:hypothetical protein
VSRSHLAEPHDHDAVVRKRPASAIPRSIGPGATPSVEWDDTLKRGRVLEAA